MRQGLVRSGPYAAELLLEVLLELAGFESDGFESDDFDSDGFESDDVDADFEDVAGALLDEEPRLSLR
jgi:hypothetical protein